MWKGWTSRQRDNSGSSHLLPFWFPPATLLPGPWKDLVIPIGSKCDLSCCSLTLPSTPLASPPLPPCPSLRSVCFGTCHHHALCGSSHDGGEPSLANYHTPDESQRERDRERGVLRYFWPLTSAPYETFPSVPTPLCPSDLWTSSTDEKGTLRRASVTGPTPLFAGLVWTAACFGFCHTHKHSYTQCLGLKASRQVLRVLWVMTNVIMLPFTLF